MKEEVGTSYQALGRDEFASSLHAKGQLSLSINMSSIPAGARNIVQELILGMCKILSLIPGTSWSQSTEDTLISARYGPYHIIHFCVLSK